MDSISKETLIGANIYDQKNGVGTTTNPFGYFSITLPEGGTKLNFSYIGYAVKQVSLHLWKDTMLTIQLHNDNQLNEVIILSDKPETGIQSSRMGASSIPIPHIKNTPALMSEADVLKSIQLLPGVQNGMNGTSGLYVRGGGPDQNLYLLDGVPLYNVDHTLGLLSVFTPEAVKKVDLYKSSFPARFGGRLSSIVDVRTNDGNMQHYHGSLTIGLLTSHLQFEGPIWKDHTSFIISARRSYIDCFLPLVMPKDERGGYSLYDINAKLNHRFSEQDRLFISFYKGKDHVYYKYKDEDKFKQTHNWGNILLNTRWNHVFTPQLFSNTTLAYNRYVFDIRQEETSSIQQPDGSTIINGSNNLFHSGISDLSISTDFDYHPLPAHNIKFGAKYIYHQFAPEVQTVNQHNSDNGYPQTNDNYSLNNSHIHAHDFSLYAEDDLILNEHWKINAGLHFSFFNVQKQTYLSLQPRLSISFQATSNIILKSSFSQMSQCTQLLSTASLAMPSDLWVPVTRHIRPMKSFQYAVGVYYTGIKNWEFSIEGYYKDMYNVLEYKDGESFLGSSHNWEDKVEMGKERSFGVEFMAQKTAGLLTGWINYTLSKSDRQFSVQKQTYLSLQPRLSISFQATSNIILKSSFSQMSQCTQLLSTASLAMPSDLWVPVTRHIRPMKSFQYAVGVYYTGIKNWEFSIEGYYKDMYNVLEYKDGESFLGSSHNWEDKVEMGKERSFGVEFMAQKTAGLLTGWINYTLSKSDRQFSTDGINNGKHFPYQYDRRHTLNLTLNYQLTRRIDFNMSWTYASGCMATLPTEKTHTELPPTNVPPSWIMDNLNKGDMDHYSSRNNYRLPASHQLNIGFNFHKQTRHGERIWNISILNAYNAMNPNFVYISREAQTGKPILKKMTILPCIPSFSYTYKF